MSRGSRLHSWLNFSHALKSGALKLRYGWAADVNDPALMGQSPESIIQQAKLYDEIGVKALNPMVALPRRLREGGDNDNEG